MLKAAHQTLACVVALTHLAASTLHLEEELE